jgi:type VI secretion system lysozyme-related protein
MSEYDRYHVPLLHCFRDAFENGDAREEKLESRSERRDAKSPPLRGDAGDKVLSAAARMRRRGLSETQIRQAVVESLVDIVNTIDLQSAVDLDDLEYVSKSILNYGLYDITHLTSDDANLEAIEQNMVAALMCYEPRIRAETLQIKRHTEFNDIDQKLRLSISAEVSYHPLDVPVDFVAEIDLGSSKVNISKASPLS